MKGRGSRKWLTFLGTALAVICVIGWCAATGGAVDVSGRFGVELEITEDPPLSLSHLNLEITVRGKDWHTSLRTSATNGESFSYLGLADTRDFGPLSLRSLLVFDPSEAAFSYFSNLVRFELLGIGLANYVFVPAQQDRAYDQITANGVVEDVRWRSVIRMDLRSLAFRTLSLRADWTWVERGLYLGALLSLSDDDGFERFRLTARYRDIPQLSFGSLSSDFLVTIDFKPEEKSFVPQIRTRTAQTSFCLTPMLALTLGSDPLSIDSIDIYGIKLECSLGEDVEFYSATSFASAKNLQLTGYADYSEVYRLRVTRPACCNTSARIEVAFYFQDSATSLFDWGMTRASIDFPISSKIRWSLGVKFPASGNWVVRTGWEGQF